MEAGSEGEINRNMNHSPEGSKRPKRQMKTPFQLEMLEKIYASMFFFFFCFSCPHPGYVDFFLFLLCGDASRVFFFYFYAFVCFYENYENEIFWASKCYD